MVNDVVFISTGFAPFYLNMRSHLTTLVPMMTVGKSRDSSNEVVKKILEWMKTALTEAQTSLEHAQHKMANMVNHSRGSEQ